MSVVVRHENPIYTTRYYGRPLTCILCGDVIDSVQIDLTGRGQHDWIPADEFVCDRHFVPVGNGNGNGNWNGPTEVIVT